MSPYRKCNGTKKNLFPCIITIIEARAELMIVCFLDDGELDILLQKFTKNYKNVR